MKKNIISAIVIFFLTFAVLLAASELSKSDKDNLQVSQNYDLSQ